MSLERDHEFFWEWWLKTGHKTTTPDNIEAANRQYLLELQRRRNIEPVRDRFVSINPDHPLSRGIPFDKPPRILEWLSSQLEWKKHFNVGDSSKVDLRFMNYSFNIATAVFNWQFQSPHSGDYCLHYLNLYGPFRKKDQILPEYIQFGERLLGLLGPPTFEEEIDFFSWPRHIRRRWDIGFATISNCISDMRDSDPVLTVHILRNSVPEVESATLKEMW